MAKSLLAVKSIKTRRKSLSETYLINRKYMGDEPEGPVSSDSDFGKRLNWYHYMCDKEDARQYLKDWLITQKMTGYLFKGIDSIPDAWIPFGSAWRARIASHGTQLTLEQNNKILADIKYGIAKGAKEPVSDKAEGASIQDRVKERVSAIIADIEEMIDSDVTIINLYEWLQKNSIPAAHVTKIIAYYKPLETEYEAALGGDKEVLEGYARYTKAQLKVKHNRVKKMIEDAEKYAGVTKKLRKPRVTKAPSTAKILQHFKFQKESNEHKIASVSASSILGAQELWTFNSKYKILSVFVAKDRGGLGVNRQAITNFDEKASKSMRIGRKTDEQLKKVVSGGKIILRKLAAEMDLPITARLNEATVLLKAIKAF